MAKTFTSIIKQSIDFANGYRGECITWLRNMTLLLIGLQQSH